MKKYATIFCIYIFAQSFCVDASGREKLDPLGKFDKSRSGKGSSVSKPYLGKKFPPKKELGDLLYRVPKPGVAGAVSPSNLPKFEIMPLPFNPLDLTPKIVPLPHPRFEAPKDNPMDPLKSYVEECQTGGAAWDASWAALRADKTLTK